MASAHRIATHRYVIDEDLIHNMPDPQRAQDLKMIRAYTELLEPVLARYGRVFLLTDGSAMFNVDAQARRHLAEWPRRTQVAASAIYGGNLVSRTLIKMIAAAMDVVSKTRGQQVQNYRFFATEVEARSWLDGERRKYLDTHPDAPR